MHFNQIKQTEEKYTVFQEGSIDRRSIDVLDPSIDQAVMTNPVSVQLQVYLSNLNQISINEPQTPKQHYYKYCIPNYMIFYKFLVYPLHVIQMSIICLLPLQHMILSLKNINFFHETCPKQPYTNIIETLTKIQQDRYLPGIRVSDLWTKDVWLCSLSCDLGFGGGGGANG